MPVPPARTVLTAAAALGLGLLLVLTLAPSSATRMQTWPFAAAAAAFWLLPIVVAFTRLARRQPDSRLGGPLDAAFATLAVAGLAATAFSPLRATLAPHLLPFLGALALPYALRPLVRSPRLPVWASAFLWPVLLVATARWLPSALASTDSIPRNAQPFGHANTTGSVAVLAVGCFAFLAASAPRLSLRVPHLSGAILAAAVTASTLGRGAMLALAASAIVVAALLFLRRGRLLPFLAFGALTIVVLVASNARFREVALTGRWDADDNESNAQRLAMITGGFALAAERPVLGWGPGSVPHVFPSVRASLPGQPDNYLQLHNTPAQLAATLGLAGLLAATALLLALALHLRAALRDPAREPETLALAATLAAAATLLLFDHPFALPAFAVLAALPVAALAPPATFAPARRTRAYLLAVSNASVAVAALLLIATIRDLIARAAWSSALDSTTPTDYAAHLSRAHAAAPADPYFADQLASHLATGHPFGSAAASDPATAVPILEKTIARNPAHESARYNLGWLLLASSGSPAEARAHFAAAARLAPARAGVYRGLALACIQPADTASAVPALAAEILLDPAFAWSPHWQDPALAPLRPSALAFVADFLSSRDLAPAFVAVLADPGDPLPAASAHRRLRTGHGVLYGHPEGPPPADYPILLTVALPPSVRVALPPRGFVSPGQLLACAGLAP